MKELFKKYKYLPRSMSLLIALCIMLAFRVSSITNFFMELGGIFIDTTCFALGLYVVSVFSMWLLFPLLPKYEDFVSDVDRKKYFRLDDVDLLFFIFVIVATVLVLGN